MIFNAYFYFDFCFYLFALLLPFFVGAFVSVSTLLGIVYMFSNIFQYYWFLALADCISRISFCIYFRPCLFSYMPFGAFIAIAVVIIVIVIIIVVVVVFAVVSVAPFVSLFHFIHVLFVHFQIEISNYVSRPFPSFGDA